MSNPYETHKEAAAALRAKIGIEEGESIEVVYARNEPCGRVIWIILRAKDTSLRQVLLHEDDFTEAMRILFRHAEALDRDLTRAVCAKLVIKAIL